MEGHPVYAEPVSRSQVGRRTVKTVTPYGYST
jgi:hypothetical protein